MKRPRKVTTPHLLGRLATMKGQKWRQKRTKDQSGQCAYCSRPVLLANGEPRAGKSAPTLDHMMPLSRGGEHHWENVVVACSVCNRAKGSMTAEEFVALHPPPPGAYILGLIDASIPEARQGLETPVDGVTEGATEALTEGSI